MNKGFVTGMILFGLVAGAMLGAQVRTADPGAKVLAQGKEYFQQGRYGDALSSFRESGLVPSGIQAESQFWQVKALMALQRFDEAQVGLEQYLAKFPKDSNRIEALYLRGRLLYMSADMMGASAAFTSFLESYKTSSFAANAYYWLGESLFTLGRLDEAEKMFQIVLGQYPTSFKAEASSYKLSLITLRHREEELLGLLKWSHEENIKNIEDFQRRELAYQDAIRAYQGRLLRLAPEDFKQELVILQTRSQESQASINQLSSRIEELNRQLKESLAGSSALKEQVALLEKENASLKASTGAESASLEERKKLLDAKEEALKLKEKALLAKEQGVQ